MSIFQHTLSLCLKSRASWPETLIFSVWFSCGNHACPTCCQKDLEEDVNLTKLTCMNLGHWDGGSHWAFQYQLFFLSFLYWIITRRLNFKIKNFQSMKFQAEKFVNHRLYLVFITFSNFQEFWNWHLSEPDILECVNSVRVFLGFSDCLNPFLASWTCSSSEHMFRTKFEVKHGFLHQPFLRRASYRVNAGKWQDLIWPIRAIFSAFVLN